MLARSNYERLSTRKEKTIAFYSGKLTDAQKRYTITEKEILSIVENLKGFITILLVQKLRIYTDNKKPTSKNFNTKRVLRRRLILEEYGPYIYYTKVEKDILEYSLSIIPLNGNQETINISTHQK